MIRKRDLSELKTDMKDLSTAVGGATGHGPTDELAREILEQRRDRLRKQNVKLDHEIALKEQQYGDIAQMRREVLRANETVKQALFSMIRRISSQLVGMTEEEMYECLRVAMIECFNNLAFEHGHSDTAD